MPETVNQTQCVPEALLSILACPVSGQGLSGPKEGALLSEDGQYRYPLIGGLPWLMAHPKNALLDWGAKLKHFQQVLLTEISHLDTECQTAPDYVLERLEKLLKAKREFVLQITQLIQPLCDAKIEANVSYDALRDRAPATQNLLSYEANLYRDWAWGEDENRQTAEAVMPFMPSEPGKLLVLGAGACKLALDVHERSQSSFTVATDINPLLLLSAARLIVGESIDIWEFPLHPRNRASVAVAHQLSCSQHVENFYPLFSDALKPAFQTHAFDTVLTPWLIDIQPHELGRFLTQLNQYLTVGGIWVNFGSLVFQSQRDSHCYSYEEIGALAQLAGFEVDSIEERVLPYLKSPYNAGYRVETMFLWQAKKVRDVPAIEDIQVLPQWILNDESPIPANSMYTQQAAQSAFLAEMLGELNGQVSLSALARRAAKLIGLDESELKHMLGQYLLEITPS